MKNCKPSYAQSVNRYWYRSPIKARAWKVQEGAQCNSDYNITSGSKCVNWDREVLEIAAAMIIGILAHQVGSPWASQAEQRLPSETWKDVSYCENEDSGEDERQGSICLLTTEFSNSRFQIGWDILIIAARNPELLNMKKLKWNRGVFLTKLA